MSDTAYRTVDPEDERAVRMSCFKCWHRWFVSIPEQNAEDFCRGLKCRCGSKALGIGNGDVKRLREMIDGTRSIV